MTLKLTQLPEAVQEEVARVRQVVSDLHAELPRWELVVWTAGNVSQRIRCADEIGEDLFVIKPSGVSYDDLGPEQMVVCTLDGAKILAERLMADDVKNNGISVLTGGTDVHLVMVDLRNSEMDGKQGEDLLAQCGITINRNTVPFDPRPASVASGLRIGTSALATRGFGPKEYEEVADIIGTALAAGQDADVDALKARVDKLAEDFPLYPGLDQIH